MPGHYGKKTMTAAEKKKMLDKLKKKKTTKNKK